MRSQKAPYDKPAAELQRAVDERHQREGTTEAQTAQTPRVTGFEEDYLVYHDMTLRV